MIIKKFYKYIPSGNRRLLGQDDGLCRTFEESPMRTTELRWRVFSDCSTFIRRSTHLKQFCNGPLLKPKETISNVQLMSNVSLWTIIQKELMSLFSPVLLQKSFFRWWKRQKWLPANINNAAHNICIWGPQKHVLMKHYFQIWEAQCSSDQKILHSVMFDQLGWI